MKTQTCSRPLGCANCGYDEEDHELSSDGKIKICENGEAFKPSPQNHSPQRKPDSSVGKTENLRSGLVSPNPEGTHSSDEEMASLDEEWETGLSSPSGTHSSDVKFDDFINKLKCKMRGFNKDIPKTKKEFDHYIWEMMQFQDREIDKLAKEFKKKEVRA